MANPGAFQLRRAGFYSIYVLFILLFTYLLNQLDRYTLPIVTTPMAQEIHYGDKACLANTSLPEEETKGSNCSSIVNETICNSAIDANDSKPCEWNYNGLGYDYQLLAGPVFILIFTFTGVPLGVLADFTNRKIALAICLAFWSLMTLLNAFVKEYWQLVLLRLGLGIGEAGCNPLATSIIADYFTEELRGSAIGVYNWGIYIGYSLAYAIGNAVTQSLGWRYVFIVSGVPGLVIAVVLALSVKEPERKRSTSATQIQNQLGCCEKAKGVVMTFMSPSLIMLCFAGAIRNAGGYVWAYNTQPYFQSIGQTRTEIESFMSWIPLVGGSLGAVLGGFISDRLVKKRGTYGRVFVLVVSQILAAPFAAGALFLPPPWAYISLIPSNIIGEMWIGVLLTVVVELLPARVRTTAIALYMFIISNIGGNVPLLVPLLQTQFESTGMNKTDSLRGSLYILFPGLYLLSSLLFILSMVVLRRDINRAKSADFLPMTEEDSDGETTEEPSYGAVDDRIPDGDSGDNEGAARQRHNGSILKDSNGKPIA